MLREFTCIICPNGCEITAGVEDNQIISIEGALCPKGETYVNQELTDPRRNIATSVLVKGGELPLASVRLTNPIPKARIFDAMAEIRGIAVEAPVEAGTVVIRGILGLDSDVIVTKEVGRRQLSES
ncbi:DUF1667 domain-containing protein [Enterocloster asparagiformis]|uniref:DUF1667 domain-containing protein n=1 Tax=Enterocloster asparagiformis TaxID=333367 RepID=UPI002A7FBCF7|nr:DUF1667 domain-containing protein [Enterocloster asparagiformis]